VAAKEAQIVDINRQLTSRLIEKEAIMAETDHARSAVLAAARSCAPFCAAGEVLLYARHWPSDLVMLILEFCAGPPGFFPAAGAAARVQRAGPDRDRGGG
jgi:3-methyladenine DNA glycosylase Mpg